MLNMEPEINPILREARIEKTISSRSRNTERRSENPHQFKTCFNCGNVGHIRAFCRENPNNQRSSNRGNYYRNQRFRNYQSRGEQDRYYNRLDNPEFGNFGERDGGNRDNGAGNSSFSYRNSNDYSRNTTRNNYGTDSENRYDFPFTRGNTRYTQGNNSLS